MSINHLSKTKLAGCRLTSMFAVARFSRVKLLDLSVVRSAGTSLFRLPAHQCTALLEYIVEAAADHSLTITHLILR